MRLLRIRIRHIEPLWWILFGAGGVLASLVVPGLLVLLLLSGLVPILDMGRVDGVALGFWPRLALHAVAALLLFHTGHRIYHGLHDLLLPRGWLAYGLTYGVAVLYTLVAVLDLAGLTRLILG